MSFPELQGLCRHLYILGKIVRFKLKFWTMVLQGLLGVMALCFARCGGNIGAREGGGGVPVDAPVFKIGGGLRDRPRWVRLPSTPAD